MPNLLIGSIHYAKQGHSIFHTILEMIYKISQLKTIMFQNINSCKYILRIKLLHETVYSVIFFFSSGGCVLPNESLWIRVLLLQDIESDNPSVIKVNEKEDKKMKVVVNKSIKSYL